MIDAWIQARPRVLSLLARPALSSKHSLSHHILLTYPSTAKQWRLLKLQPIYFPMFTKNRHYSLNFALLFKCCFLIEVSLGMYTPFNLIEGMLCSSRMHIEHKTKVLYFSPVSYVDWFCFRINILICATARWFFSVEQLPSSIPALQVS